LPGACSPASRQVLLSSSLNVCIHPADTANNRMAGVGEAIATVSCVAGLIQAYDAAARRIEQIKIRKAQRRAPPLPVSLETSVERGRQQIKDAIEEGKERFGENFEHEHDSKSSGQSS
jgi:hypothetical protein